MHMSSVSGKWEQAGVEMTVLEQYVDLRRLTGSYIEYNPLNPGLKTRMDLRGQF